MFKERRAGSASSTSQLAASTSTPRQRVVGVSTTLASAAANQTGAAVGALAFPSLGPVGVVAVRQLVTPAVLALIARPRYQAMSWQQWRPVLGLAATFSIMNLSLYSAVDRIGLGLAVTLEFLGPLTVAISTSRRAVDFGAAFLAVVGVVVLTHPGTSSDLLGIGCALIAAVAWGCYILLNRSLGQQMPGAEGTAAASAVSAVVWLPIAVGWFLLYPPSGEALLLAVTCALLSSVVPFTCDLFALRRLHAGLFGTLTSVNPVWAALLGLLVLGQTLTPWEWLGIALIVASNTAATTSGLARPGEHRRHDPASSRRPRQRSRRGTTSYA